MARDWSRGISLFVHTTVCAGLFRVRKQASQGGGAGGRRYAALLALVGLFLTHYGLYTLHLWKYRHRAQG